MKFRVFFWFIIVFILNLEVTVIMGSNVKDEKSGILEKLKVGMIIQTVLVAAAIILSCYAGYRSHELRRTIVYAGQIIVSALIIIFGTVKFKEDNRKFLSVIIYCYTLLEVVRAVLIITTGIAPVVAGITRLILVTNACCLMILSERLGKKESEIMSISIVVLELALYLVFLLGYPGVMYGRINRFIPLTGVLIAGSIALFTKVKNLQLGVEESGEKSFPIWAPIVGLILSIILTVVSLSNTWTMGAESGADNGEVLSLWTNEAPLKAQLTSYIDDITNKDSANYIPVDKRIAVFDMDGTLIAETNPYYFDHCLLIYRVLQDPDYKDKASEAEKEAAYTILKGIQTGEFPENMMQIHGQAVASAFAGMTVDEFLNYVLKFRKEAAPGYDGMTRGDSFYQPMVEVVDYLQDNGFKVYVVSGTDRIISRGIVKDNLNIPMSQVIGSDETIVASGQGGEDGLEYQLQKDDKIITGGQFVVKDLKMNKVSVIAQEIGEQPVLAFGNSTGDSSMCDYVVNNNPYKSLAFMLCCDDLEREYGNESKAQKMYDLCNEHGWTPVSMKNDWTTIYGEDVTKNPANGLDFYYDYVIPN